ncbi:MAG: NAD(P)-dependent oxidoreductase [bacterium]|nr:NAD(P)-dependent oxidoreductase [bacterium]
MKGNLEPANNSLNVLIVDDVHELLILGLREVGHNVLYLPKANRTEVLSKIVDQDILVVRTKTPIDAEVLGAAKKLRLIARAGAGLDNIDLTLATELGITCTNAGEANSDAVGEHTLGMLLMLLNNLGRAHAEVKRGLWLRAANRGIELAGKTVAIIGYGNTGKAVAEKLSGFNVKVLVYDKYLKDFGSKNVVESTWAQIVQEADILSFHVPLTNETKFYLNQALIDQMEKPFFLLNLSRGKVVNTKDLLQGLDQGKILGCALDVLENEHLEWHNLEEKKWFERLINRENVVLTPHIGGWTKESYAKISQVLLTKLLTFR